VDYLQRGINRCVEPCGTGGISAGANVGAGTGEVFRDITGGTTFNLRTLLSTTGTVSISTVGDVVELEAVASNIGTGVAILDTDLQFKTLTSTGGTVAITFTGTTVNLESLGGGESNTGVNIGAGEGVFAQKVGSDLEFKSLVEAGPISITSSPTEITIDSSAEANTASNLGAGEGVFSAKAGDDLEFKSLTASGGVTLTSTATEINIDSSGEANTASNLGAGEGVFSAKVGDDLEFKSLTASGGVTLTSTGTEINIDSSGEANTASNIGGGEGLFAAKVGDDLEFKTLTSTGGTVTITSTANTVNLEAGSSATGSTFTDSGIPLEFTLGDVTLVSQIVAQVSVRGTSGAISGELSTYRLVIGSDGASISPASDIVQVDGATPLSTLSLAVVQNVNSINIQFTRSGAGDDVQLFFSTQSLPLV